MKLYIVRFMYQTGLQPFSDGMRSNARDISVMMFGGEEFVVSAVTDKFAIRTT